MSVLQKILGKYAAGHTITHLGVTFTFRAIGQADKTALTSMTYQRERQAIYLTASDPGMTPERLDADLREARKDFTSGKFDFPQATMDYYLGAGLAELVSTITGATLEDANALISAQQVEVSILCLCVVMDSFPNLKAQALKAERLGMLQKAMPALALLDRWLTTTP